MKKFFVILAVVAALTVGSKMIVNAADDAMMNMNSNETMNDVMGNDMMNNEMNNNAMMNETESDSGSGANTY
jgi:hypothetical protein